MICDLAERYRIYDYQGLPVKYLAILVSGLGVDSRIGRKRAGIKVPLSTVYIAELCDLLEMFICAMAGENSNPNRKDRLLDGYQAEEKGMDIDVFNSIRDSVIKD